MQIYHKEKQAEHLNTKHTVEGERSTKKCKQIKAKPDANLTKGRGDLGARLCVAELLICKKELKNSLEIGFLLHSFSASTQKVENPRSLNSIPAWYVKHDSEQKRLSSEENHQNPKVSEDLTQVGCHGLDSENSSTR